LLGSILTAQMQGQWWRVDLQSSKRVVLACITATCLNHTNQINWVVQQFKRGVVQCHLRRKGNKRGSWRYGNAKVLQCCIVDSLPLVSQIRQSQRGSKIAVKSGRWSVRRQMYTAIVEGVKDCRKRNQKKLVRRTR